MVENLNEPKIITHVKNVLEVFGTRYITTTGSIRRSKVLEDIDKYTPDLIEALREDALIKREYFQKMSFGDDSVELFKSNEFYEMLSLKKYFADSETRYANKIGLAVAGNYIDESGDVVLDFPYKDAVLKAGMTFEDAPMASENFLNETVAKTEIRELLEPKILHNIRRFDKNSLSGAPTSEFSFEEDNLVVKGNNLISLHSLKRNFYKKVRLVFLDPPYYFDASQDTDVFPYNSDFKLSTWLTFMKNRLEVALAFLEDGGYLAIQMNDYGAFHLKVLLDEVFSSTKGGFVNNIIVKMSDLSGPKMAHTDKKVPKIKEHVFIYTNNYETARFNTVRIASDWDSALKQKRYTSFVDKHDSDNIEEWTYTTVNKKLKELGLEYGTKQAEEFLIRHADNVFRTGANESLKKMSKDKGFDRTRFTKVTTGKGLSKYVYKDEEVLFASSKITDLDGKKVPSESVSDIWNDIALNDLSNEGGVNLENGEKPESLLERILQLTTHEGDRVLDFFMGSATTQAVAMKMNRKFIGMEQMDYFEDISIKRLVNTIEGEQRGISKKLGWQGGGEFVAAELMQDKTLSFGEQWEDIQTRDELIELFEMIKSQPKYVKFAADIPTYEADLKNKKVKFETLKMGLKSMLDKNKIYLNFSEIEDENVRNLMTDSDYKFNMNFYEEGGI